MLHDREEAMTVSAEKRQDQPRLPAYMPAKMIVPGQASPAECIVRQISPAGAQLQVDTAWILPRTFWLRIIGDTNMYHCTMMWREGAKIGVEFGANDKSSWWTRSHGLVKQMPNRARL
jgi:hypothetical protein